MTSARSLDNESTAATRATTSDIKVTGNPDIWTLICKASSAAQGWMKSTKAVDVNGGGVVIQVTTEHRGPGGSVLACAEALTFVPGTSVAQLFGA